MVCSCEAPQKGTGPKNAKYARGGEVVTSRSRFMKTPDPFRTDIQRTDYDGGRDPLAKPKGETKLKKTVRPRG